MSKNTHKKPTPPSQSEASTSTASLDEGTTATWSAPGAQDQFHKAYLVLAPRMIAIPKDLLVSTRADVESASIKTLARSTALREELERLSTLPGFEPSCVDDAILASSACLELVSLQRTADVQSTEAKLEPWLVAEATELKSRMLKNAAHYFESDPTHGPEISSIRHGTAHTNTASALIRLAVLYANPQVAALVSKDPKYFDPRDEARARVLAETIYKQLGESKNTLEERLAMQLSQAWTILSIAWDQIRRAVTYFYWDNSEKIAEYPPLFALGRGPRTSNNANGTSKPTGETAPDPTKDQPVVGAA